MKRIATLATLLLLTALACKQEEVIVPMDTREPVGIWYVGSPELDVREHPNDAAPIMATYSNGEAISVLSQKGEWAEVRTGDRVGWAKMAELTTAAAKTENEENPTPKFRVMPLPVSAPSARGEIYIEADVNTDGDVVNTRLITNTTGSEALAFQNESALKLAKFHPIVIKGERQVFKYYHRVTY